MEFEKKPSRWPSLCLCLVATLSVLGCGEDADPQDNGSLVNGESDDAGNGMKPTAKPETGATHDGGSSTSTGTKPEAGAANPDGGTKPPTEATNEIYTGDPICPPKVSQGKLAGTIEGKEVVYDLPSSWRQQQKYFEVQEEGSTARHFEIKFDIWIKPGQTASIVSGVLNLPEAFGGNKYCVADGVAQYASARDGDVPGDELMFFKITKLKENSAGRCSGRELDVDVRVCHRAE